ncbi:MAG: response regulator [Rhodospirillales bacterium]|nr:response regulator [Rhodospirillales bacterium]
MPIAEDGDAIHEQELKTRSNNLYEASSKTVLFIDDDPIVLESIKVRLETWGCKTLAAITLEHALDLLEENEIEVDVIISDLRLATSIDGVQAIENLRIKLKNDVPGIILTGDTSPDRIKYIENAGLSILHKPINASSLAEILNEIFRKSLH